MDLKFARYEAPVFPSIALAARVTGDVRLRITAEPETGAVRNVEVSSGNPILSQAAVGAARLWQFEPGFRTSNIVEVTLRFQVRCPGAR